MLFPFIAPEISIEFIDDAFIKDVFIRIDKDANDSTMLSTQDVVKAFKELHTDDVILISKEVAERLIDFDGAIFNRKNIEFMPNDEIKEMIFFGDYI